MAPAFAHAKPVVKNLGGGLEQIASPAGRAKSLAADAKGPKVVAGRAGQAELRYPVVFDASGRPLVRITLDGKLPPRRSSGTCAPCRAWTCALPISRIAPA